MLCLFVCLFVCLSVRHQDYFSDERISMKLLKEVFLGPRNKNILFVKDPDCDLNPRSGLLFGSRQITIWMAQRKFEVPG